MILMALEDVLDCLRAAGQHFDPSDLAQTTPILFFTRWITHFCAHLHVTGRDRRLLAIKAQEVQVRSCPLPDQWFPVEGLCTSYEPRHCRNLWRLVVSLHLRQ